MFQGPEAPGAVGRWAGPFEGELRVVAERVIAAGLGLPEPAGGAEGGEEEDGDAEGGGEGCDGKCGHGLAFANVGHEGHEGGGQADQDDCERDVLGVWPAEQAEDAQGMTEPEHDGEADAPLQGAASGGGGGGVAVNETKKRVGEAPACEEECARGQWHAEPAFEHAEDADGGAGGREPLGAEQERADEDEQEEEGSPDVARGAMRGRAEGVHERSLPRVKMGGARRAGRRLGASGQVAYRHDQRA